MENRPMAENKSNPDFSAEPEIEILSSGAEDFNEGAPGTIKKEATEGSVSSALLEEWKKNHDA